MRDNFTSLSKIRIPCREPSDRKKRQCDCVIGESDPLVPFLSICCGGGGEGSGEGVWGERLG